MSGNATLRTVRNRYSNTPQTAQSAIQECPVLRPNLEEFSDFKQYAQLLETLYAKDYGMVKVVAPVEWKARESGYDILEGVILPGPIQQNVFGKAGLYQIFNVEKRSMSYGQFKNRSLKTQPNIQGKSSAEVQDLFWKNIAYAPALYGADVPLGLMEECAGGWNMRKLDSVLSKSTEKKLSGVNQPYIYVGCWKSLFCWHKEDLDLSAINYLHLGKSKFWYSIPASQGELLQKFSKTEFPQKFLKCSEYLRHKTTVVNPYVLKRRLPGLKLTKTEHRPGQFVLVFGGAYHTGFNFGFNLAQAVNYATKKWLEYALEAKPCNCRKDTVRLDLCSMLQSLEKSDLSESEQLRNFRQKLKARGLKSEQTEQEKAENSLKVMRKKLIKKERKKLKPLNKKSQSEEGTSTLEMELEVENTQVNGN